VFEEFAIGPTVAVPKLLARHGLTVRINIYPRVVQFRPVSLKGEGVRFVVGRRMFEEFGIGPTVAAPKRIARHGLAVRPYVDMQVYR